jgi:hypothetical protein
VRVWPGGQPGQEGQPLVLLSVAGVDSVISLRPERGPNCQHPLPREDPRPVTSGRGGSPGISGCSIVSATLFDLPEVSCGHEGGIARGCSHPRILPVRAGDHCVVDGGVLLVQAQHLDRYGGFVWYGDGAGRGREPGRSDRSGTS